MMCRFLVAVGATPFAPAGLLAGFAAMAEASRSPDGDRQGDGWGLAWLDGDAHWQRHRSLAPIWEERAALFAPHTTRGLAVYARSASFPGDRGQIEHNQPFLLDGNAFVFNGLLSGVSLPGRREGEIGAQRIAALLGAFFRRQSGPDAVARLLGLLKQRSRSIAALDLAIGAPGQIVALSQFDFHANYYRLHHLEDGGLQIVCSQPLDARPWKPLPTGRPVALPLATAR